MQIVSLPVEKWPAFRELRLRALKEDAEAFSSSYADALQQSEAFWKGRIAEAERGERSWLLFASEDDKLVGMIGAFTEGESTDAVTIVSVYVPREERGKGISKQLMRAMLDLLSDVPRLRSAHLDVNASQTAAIGLYEHFGFREVGRKPARTGAGQAVEQLVMQRDLPARKGA